MSFDDRLLAQCVACGFCLPACPTFQVTRREQHGPRGRIAAMRLVHEGEVPSDDVEYFESMETCVQCRACEPACPSGVRFGELMEQARAAMHDGSTATENAHPPPKRAEGVVRRGITRLALALLGSTWKLRVVSVVLALTQVLRLDRLLPGRWRVPFRIRIGELLSPVESTQGSAPAYLFRGCVMDAWFRSVHRASIRVLGHLGFEVRTEPHPPCCGAIHLHMGREEWARAQASRVLEAYRGTKGVIIVNSAGCGAAMKEYGRLLGTPEASRFSDRILDFSEALSERELPGLSPLDRDVVYQAACHLRNVQRIDDEPVRALSRIPLLRVHRPGDGELCCGAGGAYALVQPAFATAMRDRKASALRETGAAEVVTTNPGCMLHLAGAGLPVRHLAEVLEEALPPRTADGVTERSAHLEHEE